MISNDFLNNDAVVLCDESKIIKKISYKVVKDLSSDISKFLSNHLKTNELVGVLMGHNLIVPSIISSLNDLSTCFKFLSSNNEVSLLNEIEELGINLVLCMYEHNIILKGFDIVDSISLDFESNLKLLKREQSVTTIHNFENMFCVFQTSGTTGKPKFIKIPKYTIERNAESLRKRFKITPKDRIYFGTPLTFDPSMIELFLALISGAALYIVEEKIKLNPNKLFKALFPTKKHSEPHRGITVLQIVPSVFKRWTSDLQKVIFEGEGGLRILAFGGEPFPCDVLSYKKSDSLRVFNLYGVTEVSCWGSIAEINCPEDVCLGDVLSETEMEVRDEQGEVVDNGNGEIFLGSRSRKCFVNNEDPNEEKTKFYSTGDLVTITNNKIHFKGRKNTIVKRFGIKINLTVMEQQIFEKTALTNVCVWNKNKSKLLTFILLPDETDEKLKLKMADKIRIKLLHALPKEYFPDFIEIVAKFPTSSHGKINRESLIKIHELNFSENHTQPGEAFNLLCCKYLGLNFEEFGNYLGLNFFEIGGNSIAITQLLNELNETINTELNAELVALLFEKTLRECLDFVTDNFSKIIRRQKNFDNHECCDMPEIKRVKNNLTMDIFWKYDMKACVDASPIVFQDVTGVKSYVAIGSFSHIFAVVDAESGEEKCSITLPDVIESTPLLSESKTNLFVGCFNGVMYCINYAENSICWEYSTSNRIKSSAVYCRNNSAIVFGSYDKRIHCISHLEGTRIWTTDVKESIISNPLYLPDSSTIYFTTILGTCLCLSDKTGEILWKYNCKCPIFTSPTFSCFISGIVFAEVQGTILCLSREGKLLWKYQTNGQIFSSLVTWQEYIVCCCHDHNVYILKFSNSNLSLVHKLELDSSISSKPCLFKYKSAVLFSVASTKGVLYLVDLIEGCIEAKFQLSGEVFSSPVVLSNKIFIGCRDNYLNCVQML